MKSVVTVLEKWGVERSYRYDVDVYLDIPRGGKVAQVLNYDDEIVATLDFSKAYGIYVEQMDD